MLSLASQLPHRPVRAQPRHPWQRAAKRRRLSGADRSANATWRHGFRRRATRPRSPANGSMACARHGPRRPAGRAGSGWSAPGGESLSSFYDFDIFEADGSPRHYGSAPRDYQTDVLTRDYALPLIAEQATTPGPFFLWLAYHPPHDGLGRNDQAGRRCSIGQPDGRGVVKPKRDSRSPCYATRFPSAPRPASALVQRARPLRQARVRAAAHPRSSAGPGGGSISTTVVRWRLCSRSTSRRGDRRRTRATAQLDNTILVFTSDNGMLGGEHRIKAAKNRPYEEAISMPLHDPRAGRRRRARRGDPVVNVDLAPTLLELTGAQVPAESARTDRRHLARGPGWAAVRPSRGRAILIEGRDNVRQVTPRLQGPLLRRGAHRALRLHRVPPCHRRAR